MRGRLLLAVGAVVWTPNFMACASYPKHVVVEVQRTLWHETVGHLSIASASEARSSLVA